MAPPSGLMTSGSHAIVNVVNKWENCTTSGWHQGPSSSHSYFLFGVNLINATPNLVYPRNATSISKLWKMPFHAISSGIFRSLEWRFSKFANCSGVFQSLQKLQWLFSKFENCYGIFMNRHNWNGIYLICFWEGSRVSTGLCGAL